MEGKELLDDIISNPFKYLNKIPVNITYHVFTIDSDPDGAFNGIIEYVHRYQNNNRDELMIQSASHRLRMQRWAIKSIAVDSEWQQQKSDNEKAMRILQGLSDRIGRLENILKSLSNLS